MNPIRRFFASHYLCCQPHGMDDELWAKRQDLRARKKNGTTEGDPFAESMLRQGRPPLPMEPMQVPTAPRPERSPPPQGLIMPPKTEYPFAQPAPKADTPTPQAAEDAQRLGFRPPRLPEKPAFANTGGRPSGSGRHPNAPDSPAR